MPLVAVPLVVAAIVAGASQLIGALLLACVLATFAYAGVFVAVGLWLRRALWWCLLYILVWENGLARAVDGAARLSIASYAQSLVAHAADIEDLLRRSADRRLGRRPARRSASPGSCSP